MAMMITADIPIALKSSSPYKTEQIAGKTMELPVTIRRDPSTFAMDEKFIGIIQGQSY